MPRIHDPFIFRRRLMAALAALALFTAVAPAAHGAGDEQGAREFVQSLADRAIQSLTAPDTAREIRIKGFRDLFNEHFAVVAIGKWILGRHWRKATEDEQKEYIDLFEDLIVVSYVDRFAEYTGEPLNILKTLAVDEKTVIVFTQIIQEKAETAVRVNWRVGKKDDSFKVVDVVVEGTSMSNTLRSDFSSIIRREGGKVAGLLVVLRAKTASLKEPAKD